MNNKNLYKHFLKVLYPDSAKNYSDFKRINEYLTKTLNITDIYEETDVAKLEAQIEGLEKEDFNINGKHQYSNALKKYTLFLKLKQEFEKEYQEYLQPISVEKITDVQIQISSAKIIKGKERRVS